MCEHCAGGYKIRGVGMSSIVVYDLSNIAYICAYQRRYDMQNNSDPKRIIVEQCVAYLKRLYRRFNPEKVICACDSTRYWRSTIFPEYKANRKDDQFKKWVKEAIKEFKLQYAHLCVEVDNCEADDIICAVTLHFTGKVTIISSDRDFVQLMSSRVSLYDPNKAEFRVKPKNAAMALFIKCMRGDKSDNIPSAYPYVSTKRLESAFKNEQSLAILMATKRDEGKTVYDHYQHNRQLIDLSCVPNALKCNLKQALVRCLVEA